MSEPDVPWMIEQLTKVVRSSELVVSDSPGVIGLFQRDSNQVIAEAAYVAERVLDQVLPEWRSQDQRSAEARRQEPWSHLREWCSRGIAALSREAEIREKLGDNAPRLSAGDLHPWVWSGARSLWQSAHFRSAVEDAAKKVNAETQNKVGRRDVSETDLFKQAFSLDAASPGRARLRRMAPDGSDTYKSVQRGAMALAEGIFAGIRNPFGHEAPQEVDQQVGLEYLAALSVLARWVDESSVESA
jgi:hypothetical protein